MDGHWEEIVKTQKFRSAKVQNLDKEGKNLNTFYFNPILANLPVNTLFEIYYLIYVHIAELLVLKTDFLMRNDKKKLRFEYFAYILKILVYCNFLDGPNHKN